MGKHYLLFCGSCICVLIFKLETGVRNGLCSKSREDSCSLLLSLVIQLLSLSFSLCAFSCKCFSGFSVCVVSSCVSVPTPSKFSHQFLKKFFSSSYL